MPARAAWKGYLKFSQISVPVKAFTATRSDEEISLNQLHRGCGQRIQQVKRCPTHGDLTNDQIISGYKLDEHRYLPLEEAELEALRPEDDKSIQIDAFVSGEAVDPVYHSGRTYYLVPEAPPGQRPFCVLRDSMRQGSRCALARVVVSRRELLVLLRPLGRLVAMTVLEYAQRVRPAADYESEVGGLESTPAELQLMRSLIDSLYDSAPELARYRDPYIDGLDSLFTRRMADQGAATEASDSDASENELIAALRASLADAGVDPARPAPELLPSRVHRADSDLPLSDRKTG